MSRVSLGELYRRDPHYQDALLLTHQFDGVFASDQQLLNAEHLAANDRFSRGADFWLTLILCKDNRIAVSPYDPEETAYAT